MTPEEFHNGLRILRSIDWHELVIAGVLFNDEHAPRQWQRFLDDPMREVLQLDDKRYRRLWWLIERRMFNGEYGS